MRIMEKMMRAVVAFLEKSEARKPSVTSEMHPSTKRMTLKGLMNARRSRRSMVSLRRLPKRLDPYFSRCFSTCSGNKPAGELPSSP